MNSSIVSSTQISTSIQNDVVVFGLQKSEQVYLKRVLRMWKRYTVFLLLGLVGSLVIEGYNIYYLFVFIFGNVAALMYSFIKRRQILLQLVHDIRLDTVHVTLLQYNKHKQILLASQKEIKVQIRKRYRYRYPVDCLVILLKNKEVYVQEEVTPGWPPERFVEIEQYFKHLNRTLV